MKKVLLIAMGLILSVGINAQDNKMWIGGTAGFNSNNMKDAGNSNNDAATTSWIVGPNFAYMLNEKMAVGLNFGFGGTTMKFENATKDVFKSSGYNFQPYFRYYFAGTDNFKFFGDLAVDFGGGKNSFEDNTGTTYDDSKYSTFGVGVYAGAQYWFVPNWSMAATVGMLGYDSQTDNKGEEVGGVSQEETTSNFGLLGDFNNLSFSLFYHF